jgi:hypothetical protein
VLFAVTGLLLLLGSSQAFAAKGIVATLGTTGTSAVGGGFNNPFGVAVNKTGAGGVPAGTFYVADRNNRRVQRFNPKGEFVSAWGFDVSKPAAEPSSSAVYEICTIAAECKAAVAGNGTSSGTGPGQFSGTSSGGLASIAVDQATGNVFAADQTNRRISVFSPTGTFEGGFGWGAVDGTGALQFCTSVSGCSAPAASGAAAGQLGGSIGGMAVGSSGNLYLADRTNRRVDVFKPITSGKTKFVTGVEFLRAFGWGVDTNAGEFQVCTVASTCNAGIAGTNVGQFGTESPLDIVVDGSGNVFALDGPNKRVEKFSSAPEPVEGAFGSAALSAAFGTGSRYNLSYDTAVNHLYVSGSNSANSNKVAVAELDETGASVATHGTELSATTANGLAAAPASAGGAIFLTTISGGHFLYVLNEPTVPTMEPVTTHTGTTATFEGVVVSNEAPVTYHFEYSTDGIHWASYPLADASAGSAAATIPVSQNIENLSGSQLYHVRLTAIRQTPGGTYTSSEVTFTTDAAAPGVSGEAATERTDTSITLQGAVNPENQETTYHFEYVDEAEFEANGYASAAKAPASDPSVGSGGAPVSVSEAVSGLQPDTRYHFRLVATNATGTTNGEDRAFQTFPDQSVAQSCPNEAIREAQHTTYLADCRGIELVNNPDKGDQIVYATYFSEGHDTTMSVDGDKVYWRVEGGAPGGTAGAQNSFLAERGPSGWESRGLVPPAPEQFGNAELPYKIERATPDFEQFFAHIEGAIDGALARLDSHRHQEILATYNIDPYEAIGKGEVSDDGEHVLVVNPDNLQLEDVGGETPELISVMPDGLPSQCGLSKEGASFKGYSGSGYAAGNSWNPGYRMMEAEHASRVYFETAPNGHCAHPYGLYERNRETEETILIDPGTVEDDPETEQEELNFFHASEFIRSTPDGRQAYFTTFSQLDPADSNSGEDVYRWDDEAGESTCLTCIVPNANIPPSTESGQAPVLVSDDFSHIYFQSEELLVPGKGEAGQHNTYALSNGELHFVGGRNVANVHASVSGDTGYLSHDGNLLVFRSRFNGGEPLTTDQLAANCVSPVVGALPKPCEELYIYDDETGDVECISCLPGGETTFSFGSSYVNFTVDFRASGDGSTVAFVTEQPLTPRDVNGTADVYEWRDGVAHLITDGVRPFQRLFQSPQVPAVSDDGSTILFVAAAFGLTGFEQDGLTNLYAARVGGGFAPPSPPAHCSEESCQGPLQAAPGQPEPGSAGFSGRGNLEGAPAKRRCRKGRVRRHGRCVSRHTHKRRHARANHADQGRTK